MKPSGLTYRSSLILAVLLLAHCEAFAQVPADAAPVGGVMPLSLPKQVSPGCRDLADRVYLALEKQASYLLTTVHPWKDDPNLRLLTTSKSGEHWIRPNTSSLVGFCLLHRFGPYDEKIVGVSRKALLDETIVPMMRYLIAILNNKTWIHENGRRRVVLNGSEKVVESCSGQMFEAYARNVVIDSALGISSPAPLHVRYQAAAKPERGRVTDLLVLNQIDGEREWKAGEVISQFEATIRCLSPSDNADGRRDD